MNKKFVEILKVFGKVTKDLFHTQGFRCVLLILLLGISAFKSLVLVRFVEYMTKVAEKVYQKEIEPGKEIVKTTVVFLVILLVTTLISQLYELYKIHFQKRVEVYLRSGFLKKLGHIQYEYFETSSIFEKMSRVNEKLVKGYQTVIETLAKVFEILCYIGVYIFFLAQINRYFAVLVVAAILMSGIVATKMSGKKNQMFVDVTRLQQLRDYLKGLPREKSTHQEYQTSRLESEVAKKYAKAYGEARDAYLKIHWYTILAEGKALFLFVLTIIITYSYLAVQIRNGQASIGLVISFMLIFDTLYKKSEALSYYVARRVEDMFIVKEYYEIMEYAEQNKSETLEKKGTEGYGIEVNHLSYKYPQSERQALQDLNLKVCPGERIAIVGENGSGKSTFTNILLGLLTDYGGKLTVGGKEYARENPLPIGLVKALSQDFSMYQISVKENILLGKEASKEAFDKMAHVAGIEEILEVLPNKEQTKIGQLEEGSVELSGGQAQLIAAARMIANSDVPIWVFDEPTAFLDPLAEIKMYKQLFSFSETKTMFFISHRLGFAPMADRIIVFSGGCVAEMGTHEELLRKDGEYARMYAAQKSWYE